MPLQGKQCHVILVRDSDTGFVWAHGPLVPSLAGSGKGTGLWPLFSFGPICSGWLVPVPVPVEAAGAAVCQPPAL